MHACVSPTLCSIAARPILHQNVVERLVGSTAELVDPHGADPLLAHSALGVPAVDDTVITRPEAMGGEGQAIDREQYKTCMHLRKAAVNVYGV